MNHHNERKRTCMSIRRKMKQILFTSGLNERDYRMVLDKINEDNREKLSSISFIVSIFMLVMVVLSFLIESISRSQNVYLVSLAVSLSFGTFARLGKANPLWTNVGIYIFTCLGFTFGIYQGVVTAPQEQTTSFMALILAIPFWFGMKPLHMINAICLFTGIFLVGCLRCKTGYVQTADIVNSVAYSSASVIISTYATCVKAKRFYAEHLTGRMGTTDMLTGLGNRNAYTQHCSRYIGKALPESLTVFFMDVNELKTINDSLGHHVGDELLRGAADCISSVFGEHGVCYRTGGDEFVIISEMGRERAQELCLRFDHAVESWKGSWGRPLRISYGYASADELPDGDLQQLTKLADTRLYEAKALYYSNLGIDRRGHQKAYTALCESYIKILLVDLTEDTCKVIRTEPDDMTTSDDSSLRFSHWMQQFGASGNVHPEDEAEYSAKTDLAFLRDYFRTGKQTIHIFYRRKTGGEFRSVMAELMAAKEYSHEKQIVYLYVKNIERQA